MRSSLLLLAALPLDALNQPLPGFVPVGTNGAGHIYAHAAPGTLAPDDAIVLEDGSAPWSWLSYPDCTAHQWAGEDTSTAPRDRPAADEAAWRTARGLDAPTTIAAVIVDPAPLAPPAPPAQPLPSSESDS